MHIKIGNQSFSQATAPFELLNLLRRHLDQTLSDSVYLTPNQLLALKGWLLGHAEHITPGKALWLEETVDSETHRLVAVLGRKEDGTPICWHAPLPWPFNFSSESHKL